MAEFDYGNARLRAMKSRLLSHQELAGLAEIGSLKGLIAALTKTAYRKPVEAALARTSGLDCVTSALKDDLVNTLGKICRFYDGEAREQVMIVLRNYDIHNLKTILRGLSSHAKPAEVLAAMLPVGDLDDHLLAEMARLPDPRAAIDFLATMGSPYAQPLLKLRETHPGADTNRMELALEQWSFARAKAYLESEHRNGDSLSSSLNLDADMVNLLTIFRFTHAPAERRLLREWLGEDDLRTLLILPGTLSLDVLVQAGMQDSLADAIEYFTGTAYEVPLRAGMNAYGQTGRLSDLERHLMRFRLGWTASKIRADPLGIGMVLGYAALKVNEVSNLRWIAQGISLVLSPQAIYTNLEFAS
jgi:V/A-type H+-transporting ATPase subunit C